MTTLQSLAIPQLGTEDAMEVSTEVEHDVEQEEDVSIDIDFTEEQHNDSTDQDMTEEFDEPLLQEPNDQDGPFDGIDAFMEEETTNVKGENARESIQDEDIQDVESAEAESDDDLIVEDLLDETEETPQHVEADGADSPNAIGIPSNPQQHQSLQDDPIAIPIATLEPETILKGNITDQLLRSTSSNEQWASHQLNENHPQHEIVPQPGTGPPSGIRANPVAKESNFPKGLMDGALAADTGDESSRNYAHLHGASPNAEDRDLPNHLHPIILSYQDTEMFLFPPVEQESDIGSPQYFLSDERLASSQIQDFLKECRARLKHDIDDDDDDLELTLDKLELQISESTSYLQTITIAQIIEIYLQLRRNEGEYNPAPLYARLSIRPTFVGRWKYLVGAVKNGKGLSSVQAINDDESYEVEALGENVSSYTSGNNATSSQPTKRPYNAFAEGKATHEFLEDEDTSSSTDVIASSLRATNDKSEDVSAPSGQIRHRNTVIGANDRQYGPETTYDGSEYQLELMNDSTLANALLVNNDGERHPGKDGEQEGFPQDVNFHEPELNSTPHSWTLQGDHSSSKPIHARETTIAAHQLEIASSVQSPDHAAAESSDLMHAEVIDSGFDVTDINKGDGNDDETFDELEYLTDEEIASIEEDISATNGELHTHQGETLKDVNESTHQTKRDAAAEADQSGSLHDDEESQEDTLELAEEAEIRLESNEPDQYLRGETYTDQLLEGRRGSVQDPEKSNKSHDAEEVPSSDDANDTESHVKGPGNELLQDFLDDPDVHRRLDFKNSDNSEPRLSDTLKFLRNHGNKDNDVNSVGRFVPRQSSPIYEIEILATVSPESLKRPRSVDRESEVIEADLQDAKRVRAG